MEGYVANTDFEWHQFLRVRELDEVNFWFPSGVQLLKRIRPGAPFFFKLKKPHYAIAGWGYFARSSAIPAWLAWESFREANGAPDYDVFLSRIEKYQPLAAGVSRGDQVVGCLMISQPVFFAEVDWIRQPSDWARHNVRGEYYDLLQGEGSRIYQESLARTRGGDLREVSESLLPLDRYGSPILVRPRLGQGTFRVAVTDAYSRSCAVTGEHSLPALEAAHIRPYSRSGSHEVTNGLLLRSDIHRLFDLGYVTVAPSHTFHVSRRLREDYSNGRSYYPLDGRAIELPRASPEHPDLRQLAWHSEEVFRG
ncbi:MAG: HNH endonuclease [Thermoanaerobaculia bacterium]